ncbi:MBL fold metallo-hydrolase [Roseburia sp. NSJ-9]|jgi:phosphoribosyl 1,2-cyclic phosphodiesterase|uniref:MBL fold metallo-hydrolase n=1 Tax=Roseburia lenta TaxID=2763061 RepID=A0ABR7GDL6_9FIRM|nr:MULTISPECIES: MBL fold metallo-hydrolase [Roseburia]MBC5685527.1 MBL fold metallo-hydrolase [Roseburia lenta]RHO31822.1 MBL fold metallo-hydrolase [Roseburia sp. AM16-25]
MDFFSVASGSSGNCICLGSDQCHVMIDAGISGKRIEEGMNTYDYTTSDMDGVLITHEHSDHIQGLGVVARKYGLPIYATKGTADAILQSSSVGKIDPSLFHVIEAGKTFFIGNLEIYPMSISHDAADPVAYLVSDGRHRVGVVTDLGYYDADIVSHMEGLDALLLEANHDIHMLQVGAYPYPLKQRILGERGHLSNETSGQLLGQILHDGMQHILLGHLSKENNYDELAYETVRLEISLGDNPYRGNDFPIEVAKRDRPSSLIRL